jgi:hypothetical protein
VYGTTFAGHVLFYLLQAGTTLILVLAANTSFADFPRLASFAAEDGFMPRQLTKRGQRLVFSNGIIFLSVAAAVLVVATDAKVSRLIPLYAIGVFTSFTLSQTGMAKHHITNKEPKWRTGLFINAMGALLSAVVDVIIALTKFTEGGWVVIAAVPLLVLLLLRLNRQYVEEAEELREDAPRAVEAPIMSRHVVLVFIDQIDVAAARAIQYARALTPDEVRAVHIAVDPIRARELRAGWSEIGLSRVPLDVVDCPDRRLPRAAVELVAEALADGQTEVSVLLPRIYHNRFWHRFLHDRTAGAIAGAVSEIEHANVTFVPYHLGRRRVVVPTKAAARRAPTKASGLLPAGIVLPPESVPIAEAGYRQRVTIAGRIRSVRVQPRAGVATLQCTIADGTGEMQVVFLGRRQLAGIEQGALLCVTGMVGQRGGHREILNPEYRLLSPSGPHG